MLAETYRHYRLARGEEKVELARKILFELAKHFNKEPFWEEVKRLGLRPDKVKEVMLFLEERGELEIRRSSDGKRLWVLTLRNIKRNPVKLDRWLSTSKRPPTR